MSRGKKRTKSKRPSVRKRVARAQEQLEVQRRRAARPMLPVNTQARVSETLVERKRKLERRRAQRKDWESL
jgi:hypothetical protein